ncbi:MAG TPA: hypothetical protein VNT55_21215 [Baekduia sp.]|nr:hypothetical protein [Baekduia sp.]
MLRTLWACAVTALVVLSAAGPAAADPPSVGPLAAVVTSPTSATLSAQVNPGGLPTTAHFEYGTTPDLGQRTPDVAVGAGTADVRIQASVVDLAPGTHYYLAVYAANADAAGYGDPGLEFKTPRTPALEALAPTDVRPVAATLHVWSPPAGCRSR